MKKIYLHPAQAMFVMSQYITKVLVCGRGFGKSTVLGVELYDLAVALPRGRILLLGLTYNQILTLTLPPIISIWEEMGLIRDIDYVIGKAPPKGWPHTWQQPQDFKHMITFSNGTCIQLGSFDRKDHLRGGSFDAILVDEASLINKDRYSIEIIPSLRPSHYKLSELPRQRSEVFVTSMSWTSKGMWVLGYEKIMNEQIAKEKETREQNAIDKNVKIQLRETYFLSGTSWDNVLILGKATINKWKREMGKLRYQVECLNMRIKNLGNKFYPKLDEDIHYYSESFNYSYIDAMSQAGQSIPEDSRKDDDVDTDKALDLSFDFGAFSCCVVGQEDNSSVLRYNILNSFYTEPGEIVNHLVDKFIKHYAYHGEKTVYIWGDKSGNNRLQNNKLTMYQQVIERLQAAGWTAICKETTNPLHLDKYDFFNELLTEETETLPILRINLNHNPSLKISMENADIRDGKKDKRGEHDRKLDQQYATHLSDAVDYLMYHQYNHRGRKLVSFTPMQF